MEALFVVIPVCLFVGLRIFLYLLVLKMSDYMNK
jgi:hypothetical protein